jgi:hypothetical protein
MEVEQVVADVEKIARQLGHGVAAAALSPQLRAAAREYATTIPADSWLRTSVGIRALDVAKSQIHWTEAKGTERFVLRRVREFLNYLASELDA